MLEIIENCSRTNMSQRGLASAEYALKKKQTRREKFLSEMERVVPWSRLIAVTARKGACLEIAPSTVHFARRALAFPKLALDPSIWRSVLLIHPGLG